MTVGGGLDVGVPNTKQPAAAPAGAAKMAAQSPDRQPGRGGLPLPTLPQRKPHTGGQ